MRPLTPSQIDRVREMLDKLYAMRSAGLLASAAAMERRITQITGKKPV